MRPALLASLEAIEAGLICAGVVGLLAAAVVAADWVRGWRKWPRWRAGRPVPYELQDFRETLEAFTAAILIAFVIGAAVGAF